MKFARALIYPCFLLVLASCAIQNPLPTETPALTAIAPKAAAVATPTPIPHAYPPHTADQAQNTLTRAERAVLDAYPAYMPLGGFSYYYRAAMNAAWNALLYFPDDPRATTWKWKMAYYAAMAGEPDLAANLYIEQITRALNVEHIGVQDLPAWFQSGELEKDYITPVFKIETQPVTVPGLDQAYLVQLGVLEGIDIPGSLCLLVTGQAGKFNTFLVYDGFPSGGFFPTLRHPTFCTLKDLTGDGVDEIIAHEWNGGHVGTATIRVVDISTLPPKALPFNSSNDDEIRVWNGGSEDYTYSNGKIQLPITGKVGQCDLYLTGYFEWDGSRFQVQSTGIEFSPFLGGQSLSANFCGYDFIGYAQEMEPTSAIQLLDEMLKAYTPKSDQDRQMLEEMRVQKGLIHLFADQPVEALAVFDGIVKSPLANDDIWVKPVQNFIKTYRGPSDLYRACSALTACDPYRVKFIDHPSNPACMLISPCYTQALGTIMANQSSSPSLQIFLSGLRTAGVKIASYGWLDLDHDGQNELWFMIDPPAHNDYELWLASGYPNRIRTFSLGVFIHTRPEFSLARIDANHISLQLDPWDTFIWSRDPVTHEPSLTAGSTFGSTLAYGEAFTIAADEQEFEQDQSRFLSAADPSGLYGEILTIARRYDICPYDRVDPSYKGAVNQCGNYYYTLGFAAELAGDNSTAGKMYARILELYPASPMALLAREKIGSIGLRSTKR